MHRLVLLVALVACTSSPGSENTTDTPLTACPTDPVTQGTACEADLACDYPEGDGRTSFCVCQAGRMWCSDCSTSEYGFGACTAGESCTYSNWETDCDCTCTANGTWDCTSLDAVSSCPRDP